ncbi:hypothetical protein ACFFII_04630 [Paracoccus niistensis]|uniref:SMODS-associated NUDIX domain-containing protein n=2 Tax=Paracoccus niistensis TaxID=632935 RepID=A0ABV6I1J8_9RHOB
MRILLAGVDFVRNNSFVIFLAIGFIVVVAGYNFDNQSMKTVGTAIITGGVVSAVTTARFFKSLYADALIDVITGEEHLSNRSDIEEIWKRATNCLCRRRFPELKDAIYESIMNSYLPRTKDYYFKKVFRDYRVTSFDEKTGIMTLEERCSIEIAPHSHVEYISYTYSYERGAGEISTELREFKINGKSIDTYPSCEEERETTNGEGSKSVKLPATKHQIARHRTITMHIDGQAYSKVRYKTYVQDLQVNAISEVSGVCPVLVEHELYQETFPEKPRAQGINISNKNLIMPGQGHIIMFLRAEHVLQSRRV